MNLPEPPNPDHGNYSYLLIHTREELNAYGEACYRKAVEDAAKLIESHAYPGKTAYQAQYNAGAITEAAEIRELAKVATLEQKEALNKQEDSQSVHQAAQAVIDRWETPAWKDVPATATYIYALRDALERSRKAIEKPEAKHSNSNGSRYEFSEWNKAFKLEHKKIMSDKERLSRVFGEDKTDSGIVNHELIKSMFDQLFILSNDVFSDGECSEILRFIDANEYGLAIETVSDICIQENKHTNQDFKAMVVNISTILQG